MKGNDESVIYPVEKAGFPTDALPGGFRLGKGRGRKRVLGMGPEGNVTRALRRVREENG